MIDLLKDFPFSISPDVNFLFPFSSCTRAWCATGTLPKRFFLTSDVGCKQTLNNLRFENYCFFLSFGMFFWICVAVRAVCLFHGANRCIPWFPFIFQSFKRFLGVFFAFHRFSLALNDFVLAHDAPTCPGEYDTFCCACQACSRRCNFSWCRFAR